MHDCPRCGHACDCSGDIDDLYTLTSEWAFLNCKCDCDELWDEYEDDDYTHPDEHKEYYASIGEPDPQLQINMETMVGADEVDPIEQAVWDINHMEAPSPLWRPDAPA